MSDHEESKGALDADNPPQQEGDSEKGLGTETGAEITEGSDVIDSMPEERGEVRYPDKEDMEEERPSIAPQEGHVEEDPDTATDASTGAKD
ncbi:MAG: hypothetical protein MSC30_11465 [Gaiellaceae bacterium MAG52_C11]|nr:hypothetical protein [Candidatus Gaiellasilicea maunaloa]